MSEWKEKSLGEFVRLQRGHDLTEPERRSGNVPVMGSAGQNGYHDTALANGPGVVVGRSGASFGQVHFCEKDFWPHNTALYVTDFCRNDVRFVFYFLKALDFDRYNSGSAQPSLNRNFIYPIPVRVPPVAEQRAIAGVLGALDDKIELNRRMNKTLEAQAQIIFKNRFVDAVATKLPKGWRVGKLRDCCERVENGGTPKRDEPSYWTPGTIPWLTSGEVRQAIVTKTENFISEQGLENSSAKLWPAGTTVVALYGATAGQVCFLGNTLCSNQACCGLIPKKDFRYYVYLHASSSVAAFEQQTRGSAQQNLSQQIVADFPTTIPDDDALAELDKAAHPLFVRWISNLHESRTLAELRDALLPKLLSGELRVPAAAGKLAEARV